MRPLSASGEAAARRLADELSGLALAAVYSSPYRRSLETVAPLADRAGLPVHELSGLRERTLGSFGSASFEEAVARTWADFDFRHAGGESNREAQQRGVSAIRSIANRHPDGLVVAGTHGNLLALVLNAFDSNVGFEFWRTLEFPDVLRLDLEASGGAAYRRLGSRAVQHGATAPAD